MSIRTVGKRVAQRVLPSMVFTRLMSSRSRKHQGRYLRQAGVLDQNNRFIAKWGLTVLHGPFAGMAYTPAAAADRAVLPRLLGSFEAELHPVIERALTTRYQAFVDIGCAEGYYTTGFALRAATPRVIGYEVEPRERALAAGMAAANGANVTLRGGCNRRSLGEFAGRRIFLLCDCEGGEVELFDRQMAALLDLADVLIELHGDAMHQLTGVFDATHELQLIPMLKRTAEDYPELSIFHPSERAKALNEHRTESQQWLWARSRRAR